jgi:xanthine dehydrogenase small subunit
VEIPLLAENDRYAVYKISKRLDEDISALCGAFRIRLDNGVISDAVIAFGGMAGTPKRATHAEAVLVGARWSEEAFDAAAEELGKDYTPLTDWRASADYRLLVSKNLLRRFYLESEAREPVRLDRTIKLAV